MQLVSLEYAQKVSKMDVNVAAQFCPFLPKKKFPTCAKESALIPDVESLLQ